MAESNWLTVCGREDDAVQTLVEGRVKDKLARKQYSENEVRYISNLRSKNEDEVLHLSDKRLEMIRALCKLWEVTLRPPNITSHRKYIGPVIVMAKKIAFRLIETLLGPTLRKQRDFNAAVVSSMIELGKK